MKGRKYRYFAGDFETTVYEGQEDTQVWAAACVEFWTEDVQIFHSIGEQLDYFISLNENVICYYHNLKFDGAFWLSYLLVDAGYTQASVITGPYADDHRWLSPWEMPSKSVQYMISSLGQWYRIQIKTGKKIIEIRDSLKLLPFSVKAIGESFGTKHKKLEMEYEGFRYAGCEISEEEQKYIANDVLIIKEALEIMFAGGNKKLTIGSCCLSEYKSIMGFKLFQELFPNVYDIPLPEGYGKPNVGDYVKGAYKGGWCYLVKGKEGKIYRNGITADVNSLYPSMMSSESGNVFPVGMPTMWKGDYIPDEALKPGNYYFVRIETRFYLKPGMLPFIQIKNNLLYRSNEMLESSDYEYLGKKWDRFRDFDGAVKPARVTLTLTMTDWELLKRHYDLVDCEILDGCFFRGAVGIFDRYIEKYKKIKMESKGAVRQIAKLMLNSLYGKMAAGTNSSYKVAVVKPDFTLGFYSVTANDKTPGYIPVGAAITSYARNFTIRAAQANYHGPDQPGFIYADTDSIHCDLPKEQLRGIEIHPSDFCKWKLESEWDEAYYTRQKTYIEHITAEDQEPVEEPYYNIKCAGMPEKCKDLFLKSMTGYQPQPEDEYTPAELEFLSKRRKMEDFNLGLRVPGKLLPRRIRGGVVLVDTTFEMR